MPFQRRGSCIFHWRGRAWLTIWDRVKIPMYSHRLMHRKRVTCEQIFPLDSEQTCHSKDAEVAYSIGVGELGWQYGTGLKSQCTVNRKRVTCEQIFTLDSEQTCVAYSIGVGELGDRVKIFQCTVIDWCTGREWPVNRQWTNMPFQRRGSCIFHCVGELGCGTGLKSQCTVYDWCTGREWPVNRYFRLIVNKHAIPKTRKLHIPIELGWQYGTGLKSQCTVIDWHRKTCEQIFHLIGQRVTCDNNRDITV